MTTKAILVTGASGNVGGALVRELSRRGELVRAAARDPRKVVVHDGVQAVRFDYEDAATFDAALEGVDRLFLLPAPGNPRAVEFASHLLERGAPGLRQVVTFTSAGTELDDDSPLRRLELRVEGSGIPWTHLRPNWFAQDFHTLWLPGIRAGRLVLPAGDGRCAFVDVRDVAEAAAVVLTSGRHARRAYYLSGPEALGFDDATRLLGRETGRELHYQPVSETAYREQLLQFGLPESAVLPLLRLFAWVREDAASLVGESLRELLGRAPRTFATYARDYRDRF